MKSFFITFRSITYAQRGEQVFHTGGFRCRLRRTPRWMEERGCGYGVSVSLPSLEEGIRLLKQNQVPWRKVWLMYPSGEMEELTYDLS